MNTIVAQNSATVGPDADNAAGAFTDAKGNLIGISFDLSKRGAPKGTP